MRVKLQQTSEILLAKLVLALHMLLHNALQIRAAMSTVVLMALAAVEHVCVQLAGQGRSVKQHQVRPAENTACCAMPLCASAVAAVDHHTCW